MYLAILKVPEIPKDIFNRAPRYGGGLGIPGAPGNSGVFNLPYNPANDFGGFMNLPFIPGSDMGGVQLLAGSFNMPIDPNAHRAKKWKHKKSLSTKECVFDNPYEEKRKMFLQTSRCTNYLGV